MASVAKQRSCRDNASIPLRTKNRGKDENVQAIRCQWNVLHTHKDLMILTLISLQPVFESEDLRLKGVGYWVKNSTFFSETPISLFQTTFRNVHVQGHFLVSSSLCTQSQYFLWPLIVPVKQCNFSSTRLDSAELSYLWAAACTQLSQVDFFFFNGVCLFTFNADEEAVLMIFVSFLIQEDLSFSQKKRKTKIFP